MSLKAAIWVANLSRGLVDPVAGAGAGAPPPISDIKSGGAAAVEESVLPAGGWKRVRKSGMPVGAGAVLDGALGVLDGALDGALAGRDKPCMFVSLAQNSFSGGCPCAAVAPPNILLKAFCCCCTSGI